MNYTDIKSMEHFDGYKWMNELIYQNCEHKIASSKALEFN